MESYTRDTNLLFGNHKLASQAGVQQGDPLGPLLFSLAIHPLATELAQQGKGGAPGQALDLVLFYLDDGVIAGTPEAVSAALATLTQKAGELGLNLNLGKCELIATADTAPDSLPNLFPDALLRDLQPGSPTLGRSRVLLGGSFESWVLPLGPPLSVLPTLPPGSLRRCPPSKRSLTSTTPKSRSASSADVKGSQRSATAPASSHAPTTSQSS